MEIASRRVDVLLYQLSGDRDCLYVEQGWHCHSVWNLLTNILNYRVLIIRCPSPTPKPILYIELETINSDNDHWCVWLVKMWIVQSPVNDSLHTTLLVVGRIYNLTQHFITAYNYSNFSKVTSPIHLFQFPLDTITIMSLSTLKIRVIRFELMTSTWKAEVITNLTILASIIKNNQI